MPKKTPASSSEKTLSSENKAKKSSKPAVLESSKKDSEKSSESSAKFAKKETSADSGAGAKSPAPAGAAKTPQTPVKEDPNSVKLSGLYLFKLGMSSLYNEKGEVQPVTLLRFQPWVVSQLKDKKRDAYSGLQLASGPQKNKRCSKALIKHLKPAGFKEGAAFVRELRQPLPEGVKVGQPVSIHSLQKGDRVTLSGISKGAGFAGVVKRWGFKGGPASHGAKTHRGSGSIGNRTEPGRVMPGKKMAGHKGARRVSFRNVRVLEVTEDMVVVKGAVPGARNALVYLHKTASAKGAAP